MANYRLMPNEAIILQEVGVAHGGLMTMYTDELILTNLNLVCISKGVFGNTKKTLRYPLSQVKRYNGAPQVIMGKQPNGTPSLDVFFIDGSCESFSFQSGNRRNINKWTNAISCVVEGKDPFSDDTYSDSNGYDSDTLVGAFKEVSDQVKDIGSDFLDALGFKPKQKTTKTASAAPSSTERISKKCMSCSAPLIGVRGQSVKCKYCDTEQTL